MYEVIVNDVVYKFKNYNKVKNFFLKFAKNNRAINYFNAPKVKIDFYSVNKETNMFHLIAYTCETMSGKPVTTFLRFNKKSSSRY